MRLVIGEDAKVAAWAVGFIPHVSSAESLGDCRAVGVARDDQMVAACVYHRWVPEYASCEITFAASTPRWATRGLIRGLLAVPFVQYECNRVTLTIPHDNGRAERFVRGIGFTREGCARHGFGPKRHALIYGMLRREFDRMFERAA